MKKGPPGLRGGAQERGGERRGAYIKDPCRRRCQGTYIDMKKALAGAGRMHLSCRAVCLEIEVVFLYEKAAGWASEKLSPGHCLISGSADNSWGSLILLISGGFPGGS